MKAKFSRKYSGNIGMAGTYTISDLDERQALVDALEAAMPAADAMGLYVDGKRLNATLERILGTLQSWEKGR